MRLPLPLIALLFLAASKLAAQEATQPDLAAQLSEMLHREQDGHSPTPDEIQAVESLPGIVDAAVAKALVPILAKSLADPDASMRQYSLAMLIGMQSLPDPTPATPTTPAKPQPPADPVLAAYKPQIAAALAPLIPAIAVHLTDDDPETRPMAAATLSGFAPVPPAAALNSLISYLRRDDATGPDSLAVINALLQFSPIAASTAEAISTYLGRTDIPTDTRLSLVQSISSRQNQSRLINKQLLQWLESLDTALRTRLIIALPLLDLDHDTFTATKDRILELSKSTHDGQMVADAAKSIANCWTGIKIPHNCPLNQ